MTTPRPLTDVELPDWWHPLAEKAASVDGRDITRYLPTEGQGRPAGILILLGADENGPNVILTQRAATLRQHAGQPSFPGGVADPEDASIVDTALREANEEIGLDPDSVTVVTTLPELWLNVTDHRVTPVLAWWHAPHPIAVVDPAEVASISKLPVRDLVDPANRVRYRHSSGYVGPAFEIDGMLVWGFTAGVLSAVLRLAGWERPWEPGRLTT
ncbi:NUDIX hydrolase [Stackebrandtia nassauensis]|uniref:NUDIX hydrolase n=1 Tax=Stackebrandtia nassauensis (strain DSM 44728 / CIP 108903 / NRRL B-16338 / NBRC 102104 / LLR-40K-21) TaxID=446470 RepID=D3QA67_STANL|nr:CoA pyrophosphatase [Stackebrandtia nassauensis]ADD40779.1 NUDIX hydrolase [Stackebrandtia nassauensis DSM 44728]